MLFFIKLLIFLILPIVIACCTKVISSAATIYLSYNIISFSEYNDWISICFTSGSIIFAIQSFLVPFMRQSLYNTKTYITYLKAEYGNNWKKEQYRPLKNLSEFLFITTSAAFLSIIFLAIYIFIEHLWVLLISFYFGFSSFIGLIFALLAMKNNFNIMFTYNEDNSQ